MKLANAHCPSVTEATSMNNVGVLGASSFVGQTLLPLLSRAGYQVNAFSRQAAPQLDAKINCVQLDPSTTSFPEIKQEIANWVCVAPIWVLKGYLPWMKSLGARRVVVMSSTSRFTKTGSSDASEQAIAARLAEGERRFVAWSQANEIEWVILRPTLIYGLGQDKNICEMVRFIRRFSFFPVFGQAQGLRQPVHVADLAQACVSALNGQISNKAYNLSGGETLAYRDMVIRIFNALGNPPRLLSVPLFIFGFTVALMRLLPRYRNWSSAMAERMNQDLVFDHTEAVRDLGFKPRPFVLSAADLPQ